MKKHSYILILCILVVTAILHLSALKFYLYWDIWWFDIVVHFLGGIWAGATVFWIYYFSGRFKNPVSSPLYFFMIILFGSLLIGVIWEIFEYKIGATFVVPGGDYITDTVYDLAMDVVGGLSVYLYYRG
ncbi:MAG: hypothetical protein NUV47_02705 [Patescibacteria group bacterium]|nr:hypothetical protein [Patescibacteria group bacterium]